MINSTNINQDNQQYFHDVAVMPSTNNQKSIVWLSNYDNTRKIQYVPLDDDFKVKIINGVLTVMQHERCDWHYDNSTNIDLKTLHNALINAKKLCRDNDNNFINNNERKYQADNPWLLTCHLPN